MAARWFYLIICALWIGVADIPVRAQTADSAAEFRKYREQFLQAEQAAHQTDIGTDSFRQELLKLNEQKGLWQSEIKYSQGKLSIAEEKLKHSTTIGKQDEIVKGHAQVANWQARLKASEDELAKVDSQIEATAQAMQITLKQAEESAVLLPDNSIEVFIKEDEDKIFNGPYTIRRGGHILMPNVGPVMVAGKDLPGAAAAIKEALQTQDLIKNATVTVERFQGSSTGEDRIIYLHGEFIKPGPLKIPPGITPTVVTTILRSPGTTDSADLTRVRVLRQTSGESPVEEVNVHAILTGADLSSDLTLEAGDIIVVPPLANTIYVTGNVLKPGVLKLLPDDELTAYKAVLRAGGFARFANPKKVYVIRDLGNGATKKIPINIKDLQKGRALDVILQPKDTVVVPEKFFSF